MRYSDIQENTLNFGIPSYADLMKKYKGLPFFPDEAHEMGYDARSSRHYYNSIVKDIKRRFDKDGYIFLYRTLVLRKNDKVVLNDIGVHWSTEIINKDASTHLLSGKVHYSDINWYSTFVHRFGHPYESEVTLKPMRKIKDLKIEKLNPIQAEIPAKGVAWPTQILPRGSFDPDEPGVISSDEAKVKTKKTE